MSWLITVLYCTVFIIDIVVIRVVLFALLYETNNLLRFNVKYPNKVKLNEVTEDDELLMNKIFSPGASRETD